MSKKKVLFVMSPVGALMLGRFSRICDAEVVPLTNMSSCFSITGIKNKGLLIFDAHLECEFVKCGAAA